MKTLKQLHAELGEIIKAQEGPATFEKGNWYAHVHGSQAALSLYSQTENNKGFHFEEWTETFLMSDMKHWRPATEQEVKEALIKEAEKRYKPGDKVKALNGLYNPYEDTLNFKEFFMLSDGGFWIKGDKYNVLVFRDGQWAEIVKPKDIYIGSYLVGFVKPCTEPTALINGKHYHKRFWIQCLDIMCLDANIVIYGVTVPIETIEEILARLSE